MSKQARKVTVEKFTTEKIVERYKEFYRRILEDG
jgi:glycosyltransferase involved in cell wall biosynthesis